MANQIVSIEKWLYSVLSADSALNTENGGRLVCRLAPEVTSLPLTVFANQSQGSIPSLGGRGISRDVYVVKMVGANDDMTLLQAGANRISALLDDASGTQDGLLIRSKFDSSEAYIETREDGRFAHLGAFFRIVAS